VGSTAIVEAASSAVLADSAPSNVSAKISTVETYVRSYFKSMPILAEVARCESQFRQFNKDGEVLRGREVRQDVGVMQVNEFFHKDTAEKLGYDIYTLDGNLGYAKWLYQHQGTQPWQASAPCWDK
jgi:hypothetical protein